jgi:hypothetical protein
MDDFDFNSPTYRMSEGGEAEERRGRQWQKRGRGKTEAEERQKMRGGAAGEA